MIIADRYDASHAIVEYFNSDRQEIMVKLGRPGHSNVMAHIESVSNTIYCLVQGSNADIDSVVDRRQYQVFNETREAFIWLD